MLTAASTTSQASPPSGDLAAVVHVVILVTTTVVHALGTTTVVHALVRLLVFPAEQRTRVWAVVDRPGAGTLAQCGPPVVEYRHDVVARVQSDEGSRCGDLAPDHVDRSGQFGPRFTEHEEEVGVSRTHGEGPSATVQLCLRSPPELVAPRGVHHEGARPRQGPRAEPGDQVHRSAPSRQTYVTPTSRTARKPNISMTAVAPMSATTTAHGYMKIISMSKAKEEDGDRVPARVVAGDRVLLWEQP